MKRFLLLFAMLIGASLAANAQGAIKYPLSDPTGTSCGSYDFALYHGTLYACTAGVFAALPTTPSGNANFVLYPSLNPNGNACSTSNGIDPLAQVFAGGVYTCQGGVYAAVAGSGGGGNVNNSGTPTAGQLGMWVTATTLKGVTASGACTVSTSGVFSCPVPNPSPTTLGGIESLAASAHQFIASISTLGVPGFAQPACTDLSDFAASCNVDATNASNITSGTLNSARLPSTFTVSGIIGASSFQGSGNAFAGTEAASSTIACGTTQDILWADSATHKMNVCNNGGSSSPIATSADIANQVTAASSATAAKQVCIASGASKTCSYVDFPETKIVPFAAAPAGTAAAGVSYASGWTAAARAGTNNLGGALQAIPSTGATLQFLVKLPGDWDSASQPFILIQYASGANTTGTVIWTVSSACTKLDGSVTDDPAFNAESAFASQTMAAANRAWGQSGQFTAITSGNNCVAGSPVIIKVALSGTAASAINAYQAVLTFSRLLTVQAN